MNFEKAYQNLVVFSEKKDSLAFDLFFNETKDLIYRVAFHYMRCDSEAEDILQSVFLKIFTYAQEKPKSIYEIRNLKSWLIQIALNASKMLIRSKIRQREKNMKKLNVPNEFSDENQEQLELVKKYLTELPEKYRIPVCLHYVENMSFSEIASILKVDQPTIKVQISRGLEKLRNVLQKAGFAISTSSFSTMLIESSFQKAPASLTFTPTNKTIGASLDQVIRFSENPAWYALTLKNIIFFSCLLVFSGSMMVLVMNKEPITKESNLISAKPMTNFTYNFEKDIPKGVKVASLEKAVIEQDKGLLVAGDKNSTTLSFVDLKYLDKPYIISNDAFTFSGFLLIQSMYSVNNKKVIWSRPAMHYANSWVQFKVVIYGQYEILYNSNTPFIVFELPSKNITLQEEFKLCYNNLILKNVNIRLLNKEEISDLDSFILKKKSEISAVETILNGNDLVKTNQKDVYKIPSIYNLKKPIEIIFEMKEKISTLDGVQVFFLDSKDSLTTNRYGKPKEDFGSSRIVQVYLYDEMCFLTSEDQPPYLMFESKTSGLEKEFAFKLNKNLVERIHIKPISSDNKIFEKTLFYTPPSNPDYIRKYFEVEK